MLLAAVEISARYLHVLHIRDGHTHGFVIYALVTDIPLSDLNRHFGFGYFRNQI